VVPRGCAAVKFAVVCAVRTAPAVGGACVAGAVFTVWCGNVCAGVGGPRVVWGCAVTW